MEIKYSLLVLFVIFLLRIKLTEGLLQRCYSCRSRGELGSCKDPFLSGEEDTAIESVPCASGWCGKMLETEDALKEEYGIATQRRCLQRGPSDNEERCAYTKVQHRKVFMCFCRGDLCNSSNKVIISAIIYLPMILIIRLIL